MAAFATPEEFVEDDALGRSDEDLGPVLVDCGASSEILENPNDPRGQLKRFVVSVLRIKGHARGGSQRNALTTISRSIDKAASRSPISRSGRSLP